MHWLPSWMQSENNKCTFCAFRPMKRPYWFIVLTAIACLVLLIIGALMPPLNQYPPLEIIEYEAFSVLSIIFVLCLINERGFPDPTREQSGTWP